MRAIVFKVDVDTYRGTREGVPRLTELFKRHRAPATFLFTLGPDHTGRAIRRVFRKGFFGKVQRTSVLSHYGIKTLCYGTLLPGPNIGRRCADNLRAVADQGFEVGIHCHDHTAWQDNLSRWTPGQTRAQLDRAALAFETAFGRPAPTHGSAGWQTNAAHLLWNERFKYASDCRGDHPFRPVVDGTTLRHVQLPTTLPTMDELIGLDGVTESNVAEHLLRRTDAEPPQGHVFTLHAELEGQKLLGQFEAFVNGLARQGYEFLDMGGLYARLDPARIPLAPVVEGTVYGRSGTLAVQGQSTAPRATPDPRP